MKTVGIPVAVVVVGFVVVAVVELVLLVAVATVVVDGELAVDELRGERVVPGVVDHDDGLGRVLLQLLGFLAQAVALELEVEVSSNLATFSLVEDALADRRGQGADCE